MGIFRAVTTGEKREVSLSSPTDWLVQILGGDPTDAGVSVTRDTALGLPAVWSAVGTLVDSTVICPLVVYKDLGTHKVRNPDSPLWTLLHERPNPRLGAREQWGIVVAHLALDGNAFLEKVRDKKTELVTELWPVAPWRVNVVSKGGRLFYEIDLGEGKKKTLTSDDIIHIRGFGYDGVRGLSPIAIERQALGIQLAQRKYQGRFYGNSANPGGLLTTDKKIGEEGRKSLASAWESMHSGTENAGRVAVLEDGLKWQQMGISLEDQQWIEQAKLGVQDVARIFRIPAWKINAEVASSMTYANVEQSALDFVKQFMAWLVRIEDALMADPELKGQDPDASAEFNFDAFLRADTTTRYAAHRTGIEAGFLSVNDVRARENLPPVDGGDAYRTPSTSSTAPTPPENQDKNGPED